MNTARYNHLATMLPNGAVLITGGVAAESDPETAEVFDSVTDSFTVAASLEVRRVLHTVTMLPDGDLILAGGNSTNGLIERLHCEEGTWTALRAGQLREPRTRHVAVLLGDGRIVFAGGASASNAIAEIFDPRSADSQLIRTPDSQLTPVAANRGRILFHGYLPGYVSGAELYDIESNRFLPISPVPDFFADTEYLATSRGNIILIGGAWTDAVHTLDVRASTCTPAPPITARWCGNAVVELRDGRIFIVGGYLNNNGEERRSTEFYAFRLDSDHDGMDDEWELANGLNPARTEDATEDADGEGHLNLHEYLAGTDPRDPQNVLKIDAPLLKDGKMMIRFSTVLGKYYRIEKSNSPDSQWEVLSNSISGTGRPVEIEDPVVPGAEPCIYRVVLLP